MKSNEIKKKRVYIMMTKFQADNQRCSFKEVSTFQIRN